MYYNHLWQLMLAEMWYIISQFLDNTDNNIDWPT